MKSPHGGCSLKAPQVSSGCYKLTGQFQPGPSVKIYIALELFLSSSFFHSSWMFIQHMFAEHLLCARPCSGYREYSSEQNTWVPLKLTSQREETDREQMCVMSGDTMYLEEKSGKQGWRVQGRAKGGVVI